MKYVIFDTRITIYKNKIVLKERRITVTESSSAKRIKILEKARELRGFANVWSQDGKIMFFDKIINKVKVTVYALFQMLREFSHLRTK